jgi:hypothetical protein
MKAFLAFAAFALTLAACTYHRETVVQKPTPTTAVVVQDAPPPPDRTIVVPTELLDFASR